MKLHLLSADGRGQVDGTTNRGIYSHLPLTTMTDCDAVVVPISVYQDYTFNPGLREIRKPYVFVDFMESPDWDQQDTQLFGREHPLFSDGEWAKLGEWVAERPPVLYFKRELLEQDLSDTVLPIEWPSLLEQWPREDRANFDARKVEVFFNWGFSNPLRPQLHGEIFTGMCDHGLHLITAFDQFDENLASPKPRMWATIHTPDFRREPMSVVLLRQSQSKMCVSLPGAGVKCFRSSEAPVNTVPVFLEDELAWSYPWTDGVNCIRLSKFAMFEELTRVEHYYELHDIYMCAQDTIQKYQPQRYVNDYILPAIAKRL